MLIAHRHRHAGGHDDRRACSSATPRTGSPDKGPKFSFILVGWGSGTGEASSPLKSLLATFDRDKGMGASNRGRYSNPQVDKLINDALATVDDAKRRDLLARATEVAIEDVGIIPLHYQVNTWAMRKRLQLQAAHGRVHAGDGSHERRTRWFLSSGESSRASSSFW